ncbi:sugar ABC transporter permease [Streptomyces sp. B6B3]|uniref:carbohydrate ABC transporter permease n=1 Tax=Streptomyces sp. B6B3 TaxID=3153570 RepID=UPI00325EDA76
MTADRVVPDAGSAEAAPGRRPRLSPLARREERRFYLFATPWMVGFVFFGGGPIIASAVISLTDWSLLSTPHWVGLRNYREMLNDPTFYQSLRNTVYFGFGSVLVSVLLTFGLALLLNQPVRAIGFFRMVFYMPSIVSGLATALLWVQILHPDYGLLNRLLGVVGIRGPGWLSSPEWAIPALIMMSVWGAGTTMVIYLAGLQSVPQEMYEVATLDGAGWWGRFWHVTIPFMSPVIFFNVITGLIGSLQAYVLVLIMTDGGPGNATLLFGLYIYRQAFVYFDLGYASALAWVMLMLIMVVTFVQFRIARRWVYYESS